MMNVHVGTAAPYEIFIGRGLLTECGDYIRKGLGKSRIALISDSNVDRLYGDAVEAALIGAGHSVFRFPFEGGEANKTLGTVESLLTRMMQAELTRSDLIVALGGGITGDIAGFTAASYLRGIRYVQIPTTLLAAVDSSVGGKTGVNLAAVKNQVGAIWQPSMVLCDPDTFSTLSDEQYADGVSEAIKYGVAFDRSLFELLYSDYDVAEVIRRCVTIKSDVVAADERDNGVRQLLNFGHTAGHAIEKLTDHEFSHGQAVAVGMVIMTKAALRSGFCREDFLDDLIGCLTYRGLPTSVLATADELISVMKNDKKRRGDSVTLVLPRRLGECALAPTPLSELDRMICL